MGLSEAAVRQRVQKLVEGGVMQIVAVTDPMQIGFARQAMIAISATGDIEKIAEQLAEIDEVDYIVVTAGAFDILAEVVVEDDDHLLELINGRIRAMDGVTRTESFLYLKLVKQTYNWGTRMTRPRPAITSAERAADADELSAKAREHLWMHFTRLSAYADSPVPTIVRGEGARIFDVNGKSYLDGLAGLFVVQAGHGRRELAEAAAQAGRASWRSSRCGPTPHRRLSSSPTGSPTMRRAT